MNGEASTCVLPSTEMLRSLMASEQGIWLRGVARLISSARTIWANSGPG